MLARCARCQGTFTTDRFGRQTCPHCGSELLLSDPSQPPPAPPAPPAAAAGGLPPPPPPGGGWQPPPPPPPSAPEPDLPSPFAERSRRGFFSSYFETWKLVATEPQRFFARVRVDQLGTALLFGLLASTVGGLVAGLLSLVTTSPAQLDEVRRSLEGLPAEMDVLRAAFSWLLGVLGSAWAVPGQAAFAVTTALIGMLVTAGVVHVFLLMLKGAARGFSATLTVVAFAYGLDLLLAVPGCGPLIAIVWRLVVIIIGLAAIHRADVWKPAVAVLLFAFTCCCCVFSATGAFFASLAGVAGGGGAGGVTDL